ncbi:MAG: hypothetical protein ACAH07_05950 [Methylophilaceae bacterium]|nr:hypothetical protein [Methyloradius sp.]
MARFAPYGRAIYNLRKADGRLGLLVVATSWPVGKHFEGNERVARTVILDDFVMTQSNLMFMVGLDVLVCPDPETTDDRLNEVITACFRLGKASQVWCETNENSIQRMILLSELPVAATSPIPLAELARSIKQQQIAMMLTREGIYADPATHDDSVRALFDMAEELVAADGE